MDHSQKGCSRRTMLKQGSAALASLAAIPLIVASAPARAMKLGKADMHYQDQPKDGKRCIDCGAYELHGGGSSGSCKIVDGPISPDGWCMAFSPKGSQ
jgi:hypothetical protein